MFVCVCVCKHACTYVRTCMLMEMGGREGEGGKVCVCRHVCTCMLMEIGEGGKREGRGGREEGGEGRKGGSSKGLKGGRDFPPSLSPSLPPSLA